MSSPPLRKLTPEEIEEILNSLRAEKIRSSSGTNARISTESLIRSFRLQLLNAPPIDPQAIPELKEIILLKYNRARISAGTPAGIRAAVAMSAIAMQTSLNSFHTTGTRKTVASSSERMEELVNATLKPKDRSCQIHFSGPPLTFDDVLLRKRADLTSVTVADVLKNLNDFIVDSVDNVVNEGTDGWWYDLFLNTFNIRRPVSTWVARLYINANTLYAYDIQMKEIADVLEDKGTVIAIYSPMSVGIIDIYPREQVLLAEAQVIITPSETEEEETEEEISVQPQIPIVSGTAGMHFLRNTFIPTLDSLRIKGVSGITRIFPATWPVWSLVQEEINIEPLIWRLYFNKLVRSFSGIQLEHLERLCQVARIEVLERTSDYLLVKMETPDRSPGKHIEALIADDKRRQEKEEEDQRLAGVAFPRALASSISTATTYVYAESNGSNLRDLLARSDINDRYTMSNDGNEILETLGIEATRNFLIREYLSVVSSDGGSSLDPRHLTVIVDLQTFTGRFMPYTNYTISRMQTDPLTKSSFQKPVNVFTMAAGFGQRAPTTSVSSSAFLGRRNRLGTGFMDIDIDPQYIEEFKRSLAQKSIDSTDFRRSVASADRSDYGVTAEEIFGPGAATVSAETLVTRTRGVVPAPAPPLIPTEVLPVPVPKISVSPRPVISNLAVSVAGAVKEAPCLEIRDTTISVQPLPPLPSAKKAAAKRAPPSVISVATATSASGLPPGVRSIVRPATRTELPTFNPAEKNILADVQREQTVEPASIAKFLESRKKP